MAKYRVLRRSFVNQPTPHLVEAGTVVEITDQTDVDPTQLEQLPDDTPTTDRLFSTSSTGMTAA